jgi:putative ABC transport system permease protein
MRGAGVRTRDVVGLALVALWQRKVRAVLATLGVAVGAFLLVTSLSIGQGVQRVLLEQLRRQDQLRRIVVWQGAGGRKEDIPEAELEVPGEMSEARRERLREAVIRRWQAPARKPPPGLSAARIEELSRLEHVEAVTPGLNWIGRGLLGGQAQPALIRTASPDDPGVVRRLVAGRFLEKGEREGVVVSEYLAYRWGASDERDVGKMLGRRVRLEVTQPTPGAASLMTLLNVHQPNLTPEEAKVLARTMTRLPEVLGRLDLPADERKVLGKLLAKSRPGDGRILSGGQPIIGVFRDVTRAELSPWDGPPRPVDVLIPAAVARELYFAAPGRTALPQVVVRVDHERNLRGVHERIKAMGLECFSLVDLVDQIRLNVLLIAIACTFVALVALAVAGLGIANTMLMSVLERTHEIGVMKAVGARDADVQLLFLMEGVLTGAAGSLLGLLASWLVSFPGDRVAYWIVARQTPMRLEGTVFVFPPWLVLGVPLLVCLFTTAAAVYPARRAARVDPIAALRQR